MASLAQDKKSQQGPSNLSRVGFGADLLFGGVKGRSELPDYVERYLQGEFKLSDFITHTMGLDGINEAFTLMHEGKSIRSVIHFDT